MEPTPRSSAAASASQRRRTAAGGADPSRQRSRLQMHAPASIQVGPAEPFSEWQTAIPLLSPLDVSPIQSVDGSGSEKDEVSSVSSSHDRLEKDDDKSAPVGIEASSWRHPAEPFHYGNLQGKTPGFVFTHCG